MTKIKLKKNEATKIVDEDSNLVDQLKDDGWEVENTSSEKTKKKAKK